MTIQFFDEESRSEACVIVRRCGERIALCVSLRSDGDVETFMDKGNATHLIEALREALKDEC